MQWLATTPAAHTRYGATTLSHHLMTIAAWLTAWSAPTTTVLTGLAHALCGTQTYRTALYHARADRGALERVFGPEALALALDFASCNRTQLASLQIGSTSKARAGQRIRLDRDRRGPEPALSRQ